MNRQYIRSGRDDSQQIRVILRMMSQLDKVESPVNRAIAGLLKEKLTLRQVECLRYYYEQNLNMTAIGRQLGLHPSTVSRHICRGEEIIHRVLEYSRQVSKKPA